MRVVRLVMVLALVALLFFPARAASAEELDPDVLYLFWGDGCPHCAAEKEFLEDLTDEHPELDVEQLEVWYDEENRALFVSVMEARGQEPRAVPTTIYGDRIWVGFTDAIAAQISDAVASVSPVEELDSAAAVEVPLVGTVDVAGEPLLPATFIIALVDGFNPCSLWVLSILLALVIRSDSRKRVLAVGGMFLAVTTALYGVYILGLYGALSYASNAAWIRVAMAAIALGFGIVNVKDFFWFKKGVSLTIPDRAKPRLYERMRNVAADQRPIGGVLLGTAGLAVGVSLLETPCTAGYPLLWADLLAAHDVGFAAGALLFGVYMVVFLFDELAVFGAAVLTMRVVKLDQRHGRALKLISGVLMIVLAGTLIFVPEAMQTLAGATWVFVVSASITMVVLAGDRLVRARIGRPTPKVAAR